MEKNIVFLRCFGCINSDLMELHFPFFRRKKQHPWRKGILIALAVIVVAMAALYKRFLT